MLRWLVLVMTLATGCTAAYRHVDGGALARPGVAGGTTRSVYIGDRGGLFTRLGLGALTLGAAMGSVENLKTETTSATKYDARGQPVGTVTTTTTTGTVNPQKAAAAARMGQEFENQANEQLRQGAIDPTQNYASYTGGLEIASESLGGDTSGWMFDFGVKWGQRYGVWGLRGAVKLGFGKFTFHDRPVSYGEPGGMSITQMADSTYSFFGMPSRLGLTYKGTIEAFVQLDLNVVSLFQGMSDDDQTAVPSPWRAGGRLFLTRKLYAEAGVMVSAMRAVNRSTLLEVGLEF